MDRVGDEQNAEEEATQEHQIQVMDMEIPRQPRPEPSDGEVSLGHGQDRCIVRANVH